MKKKTVTFGILGLGRVVEKRVASVFLNELKNSEVLGVFDKNKKKNLFFSKKFNCSYTESLNSFLKKKYNFIYIATESGNHFKHIELCFKNNQNVIVEKPPVLKINQLKKLNNLAQKKKLKFYVIFQNRLNKSVSFLKNFIKKKKKNIVFSTLNLSWSRPQSYYNDWHGNWKMDGGVASQQGIHYIDILCFLFGSPLKSISHISNKSNNFQAEDTHSSLIVFKNNLTCTCNFTTALRPVDYEASINIVMKDEILSLGGLCCNRIDHISLKNKHKKNMKSKCRENSEKVKNGYGNSHNKSIQLIIDFTLKKKFQKPLEAIETLPSLKLLNMMYMSFEKKKWIKFNDKNISSKLG